MAQLKDTVVSGSLRATDTIYTGTVQLDKLYTITGGSGTAYSAGTNGQVLAVNSNNIAYWKSLTTSDVSGTVTISHGGTGTSTAPTQGGVIYASSTSAYASTGAGTSGQYLKSNGSSAPTWASFSASTVGLGNVENTKLSTWTGSSTIATVGTITTGTWSGTTIAINKGGTGTGTAPTKGGVIYASSTSAYASTAAGTSGQFLKSNGANAPTWDNIKTSDVNPVMSRTYSNYTVSANDGNTGVVYFGTVTINDTSNYYAPWYVHYTLEVTTSEAQTQGQYDVWIGYCGTEVRYKIFNHFYSGSYYPIYYHRVLYPKNGYSNQGAHLGIRVQSARNPTTLARTYKINILETYGCTVTFKDTLVTYTSLWNSNNNSTYFYSDEYNATGAGLQEVGDSDDWASFVRTKYPRNATGVVGIMKYGLFMEDSDGNFQGLSYGNSGESDGTTASKIHTINTTAKFKPTKVFYRNNGNDLTANNSGDTGSNWKMWIFDLVNLKYTFNANNSLTGRLPFYLMGTIDSNGYFSLSGVGYSQAMSDTSKAYIYVGQVYNDTNGYRCTLELENPCYVYAKNGWKLYTPPHTHTISDLTPNPIVLGTSGNPLNITTSGTNAVTLTATSTGGWLWS